MGLFKISAVTNLEDFKNAKDNLTIKESDYSFVLGDNFVQLEYVSGENSSRYSLSPGLSRVTTEGSNIVIKEADFLKNPLLENYSNTSEIQSAMDDFFNNLDVYKELNIDVPTRNILVFGPPGVGKTATIHESVRKYLTSGDTACIIWDTIKFDAMDFKQVFQNLGYNEKVKNLIITAEDIGGFENPNYEVRSDSALLSLLDNSDKTFTIPTMIIATTNYPENLAEAIANRSGRFDDKIKIPYPDAASRTKLLEFYAKRSLTVEEKNVIEAQKSEKLTAAHLKEIFIRSKIRRITILESAKQILSSIAEYENEFKEPVRRMGLL